MHMRVGCDFVCEIVEIFNIFLFLLLTFFGVFYFVTFVCDTCRGIAGIMNVKKRQIGGVMWILLIFTGTVLHAVLCAVLTQSAAGRVVR
jgi:hypothetical protein